MKRYILFYLLLFLCCFNALPQVSKDALRCFNNVREYVFKTNQLALPAKGKAYHFRYKIISVLNDDMGSKTVNNVEIKIGADYTHYKTDDVEFFQDTAHLVLIIDKSKSIVVSGSSLDYYRNRNSKSFAIYRDSLFNAKDISSFQEYADRQGRVLQALTLSPVDDATLNKTIYHYDVKKNKVVKSETFYKNNALLSETVVIEEEDYNYKLSDQKPALFNVVDRNMHLLPKYQGYTFVDNIN